MKHIDPETLAAFAEGRLSRKEIAPVLLHLRACSECTDDVQSVIGSAPRAASARRVQPVWIAVAAAAVVAIVAAAVLLRPRDPMQRVVSLAPQSARTVEPRLSGFGWSRYAGPLRAANAPPDAERMKLVGAAGELLDRSKRDPSAAAQHDAGVALLLIDQPLDAVAKLRAAAAAAPNDAKVRSDLAAAEYAQASRQRLASLYPVALADADAALRLDGRLAEALFNRALILERLGLAQAARDAWQRYLEVDPASPWADEAREHLRKFSAATNDSQFRSEQPRLERAAAAGDAAAVAAIVGRFRQQSRAFGEGEYLGRWGEAELRGDAAEAARQLTVARAIGNALARGTGESLLHDAVEAIDRATPQQRRAIAEAHVAYRRGRIAFSRHSPAAAEEDLRRAAGLFAGAADPMAYVARYYAASARHDRNDLAGARAELEALLGEIAAQPRFPALAAHARWELALCLVGDDDWSGALPLVRQSADAFCRLGETDNCGFLEAFRADVLVTLGRPDDAWAARIRAFELLGAVGRGDRFATSLAAAVRMELRSGRLAAARALAQLERAAQRGLGNGVLAVNTLMRNALLDAQLGNDDGARQNAAGAADALALIPDAALRSRSRGDVLFAEGAAALRSDPRRSAALLGDAIDAYRAVDATPFLTECHLLRSRVRLQLGDADGAQRDLDDGIAVYERHAIHFAEGVVGTGVFDAGNALYRDAIGLALARGNTAAAFAYAEHALAQIGAPEPIVTLADLQQRLRGSNAALLELVVLPHDVVVFAVTASAAEAQRRSIEEPQLAALVDSAANGDRRAMPSLYALLIAPAQPHLARAKEAIVVADRQLARVPFAALVDPQTNRMLVEQLALSMAPSASVLRLRTPREALRSIVALSLASDDVNLPGSADELADIRRFYAKPVDIDGERATAALFFDAARNADVIHLSGHSAGNAAASDAELFLGPAGRRERLSWRRLSTTPLTREPIVVLAACDTLAAPGAPAHRALSLGGAFLAAGAGDVVGTLSPIADDEARLFFHAFHRALASGADAAAAVREAQLEAIRDRRGTAWQSVAVLTRHM